MIELASDLLIDFLLIVFPIAWISRELALKPKKATDLVPALNKLGLKKINAIDFAKKTVALFAALAIIGFLLAQALTALQLNDLVKVSASLEGLLANAPLFLVYLLVVRVVAEEVFFRGLLVNKTGVLFSTALFALAHVFYYSWAEVIGAFVLGLVLALAFRKWQNLLPIIAAHLLYNLFALMFILGVF